jgi:hypothetical protein
MKLPAMSVVLSQEVECYRLQKTQKGAGYRDRAFWVRHGDFVHVGSADLGDPPKTDLAGVGSSEHVFLFYP